MEWVDNELRENLSLRKGWVIVRRDRRRFFSFGEVRYERTLFKNKKLKAHAHLADRLAGYKAHQRLDTLLEADLLEEAVDNRTPKQDRALKRYGHQRIRANSSQHCP